MSKFKVTPAYQAYWKRLREAQTPEQRFWSKVQKTETCWHRAKHPDRIKLINQRRNAKTLGKRTSRLLG